MTRFPRILTLALMLAASIPVHAAGPTGFLNDTGQDTCYDGTNLVACATANSGDAATYPRQDGRFGRDAKAAAGTLTKTGAGAKAFDYTKICMNGALDCTGASNTVIAPAPAATDWACTKDNVTNLIWSLQLGLGDWTTYATVTLPNATNAASRCGYNTGWRLPTRRELLSIVNNDGSNPAIDGVYFPGTVGNGYWSLDTYAPDPALAWVVLFSDGSIYNHGPKFAGNYIRLVRSGQ